jgi:inosine/xanthosine triphosphatase
MKIGIGSKNKVKIDACKKAFSKLRVLFPEIIDSLQFSAIDAKTDIPDMPLSSDQTKKGALQRAFYVIEHFPSLNIGIGMEGGVHLIDSQNGYNSYLQNWVYAYDGSKGFFGGSPCIPLPDAISRSLQEGRVELADIMDQLTGLKDVRSNQGAFGILTRDIINRTDAFELAVICSMIPHLNRTYY